MSWQPLSQSLPYPWPLCGHWSAGDTALIVIDMQNDFLDPGGYFGQMGYNIEDMFANLGSIQGSSIGNTGLLSQPVNRSPYART